MQCFNNDPYPNAPQRLALSSFIMFMFLFLLSLCLVVPGVISLTSQLKCERKIVSVDRLTLNDTIPNRIKYRYTLELSIKDNSIRYNSISIYECFEGECEINKFENFTTFCTYDPRKKGPRLDTQADFIGLFAAAGICLIISFGFLLISLTVFIIGLQFIFELLYRKDCFKARIMEGNVYFKSRNGTFSTCLDLYLKFTGFSVKQFRKTYKP
ncbi:predicted protein [Naegleria gruberi]|uniref:Predicted protein n=1 Tax=Naegleria gruberi TaxID=5762 RepID=D2W3T9_NAEGR|nr:uncharacterized protein NAEGRDRAFT_76064 [Naegleria gruberi]EFC36252.1 predicted protein [Naegleria gruberi]|eukprot:XP_002668996.1 predicted protein [Naegleria gruberi strain NEG-M]